MYLLIDGDIIAYKAAAAAEKPINWGEGLWTLHAWEDDVCVIIDEFIEKLYDKELFGDGYEVALSSSSNFRKDINPDYKANRTNTRKPMLLGFARDYIMATHNGTLSFNLEADDVLGIGATASENCVIWSEDKDLLTVYGNHLIDGKVEYITGYEADYKFFTQVLTGDATDNYSGCPNIGPATAEKIFKKADKDGVPLWDAILAAYEKEGLNEDFVLMQARMAYILHNGDYNENTGEVKLWTPETMLR